jgi:type II restriction/modification system DNA methylase subunit YeeA
MLFAGLRVAPLALLGFLIVDPACGSGAFLIEAHQYLLDWYRDRYVEDSLEKWSIGGTVTSIAPSPTNAVEDVAPLRAHPAAIVT